MAAMKEFGWEYIAIVDIQWYAHKAGSMRTVPYIPFSELEMDEYSCLLPDPERFPSSAVVKRALVHWLIMYSLGLKFGIHIMRGILYSSSEPYENKGP
ncbi:MAG: hypothetical protein ACLUL2_11985 [Blautia sp.]